MNWFERYGVAGTYFIVMTVLWLKGIYNIHLDTTIIGAGVLATLPAGYTLSILSQVFYYSPCAKCGVAKRIFGNQIHKKILRDLDPELKEELHLSDCSDESICETKMTTFFRFRVFVGEKLNAQRYLADFATRRWDVLAINRSIMISIMLSLVFSFSTLIFYFKKADWSLVILIPLLTSVSVFFLLLASIDKMEQQVVSVNKDMFDDALEIIRSKREK